MGLDPPRVSPVLGCPLQAVSYSREISFLHSVCNELLALSSSLESRAHITGDGSSARSKYPLGTDIWQPGLGWHHATQASWCSALPVPGVQVSGGSKEVGLFHLARAVV